MSKQDRQGARTPADIERRYGLGKIGKSFAEVLGIAEDARNLAELAKQEVDDLDHQEIFNRLTNNGAIQGVYMENGELYINAEYIAFEKLNGKDLAMNGKFTNTTKAFLEPGEFELETIKMHMLGTSLIPEELIPFYDFNNDGVVNALDLNKANKARLGVSSLAGWSGAIESEVTLTIDMSNPAKAICITGTNMWGRYVESYIGVNFTTIKNPEVERKLEVYIEDHKENFGADGAWSYRKWSDGTAECWARFTHYGVNVNSSFGTIYESAEYGAHSYPFSFIHTPIETISLNGQGTFASGIWTMLQYGTPNTEYCTKKYCFTRPRVGENMTVEVDFYVVGKWK